MTNRYAVCAILPEPACAKFQFGIGSIGEVGMKSQTRRHDAVTDIGDGQVVGQNRAVCAYMLMRAISPRPLSGRMVMRERYRRIGFVCRCPCRYPSEAMYGMRGYFVVGQAQRNRSSVICKRSVLNPVGKGNQAEAARA